MGLGSSCGCDPGYALPDWEGGHYDAGNITAQCLTVFGTKCAIKLLEINVFIRILKFSIWLLYGGTLEQAELDNHYSIKYSSHFIC